RSRRLVHLAEDEGGLVAHARLRELAPERSSLTGPLTHTAEDGVATELGRDVADELGDDDGLADACTAEDADLTTLGERCDEIDDLGPGLEHLNRGRLILEGGRRLVDRASLRRLHLAHLVDGIAGDVEDAAERARSDRNRDRLTGIADRRTAAQAVRRAHGDGANAVVAEVLLHLEHEPGTIVQLGLERVVDFG